MHMHLATPTETVTGTTGHARGQAGSTTSCTHAPSAPCAQIVCIQDGWKTEAWRHDALPGGKPSESSHAVKRESSQRPGSPGRPKARHPSAELCRLQAINSRRGADPNVSAFRDELQVPAKPPPIPQSRDNAETPLRPRSLARSLSPLSALPTPIRVHAHRSVSNPCPRAFFPLTASPLSSARPDPSPRPTLSPTCRVPAHPGRFIRPQRFSKHPCPGPVYSNRAPARPNPCAGPASFSLGPSNRPDPGPAFSPPRCAPSHPIHVPASFLLAAPQPAPNPRAAPLSFVLAMHILPAPIHSPASSKVFPPRRAPTPPRICAGPRSFLLRQSVPYSPFSSLAVPQAGPICAQFSLLCAPQPAPSWPRPPLAILP